MAPRARKPVDAKVVDVDDKVEPVDAVVVDDKRNTFGKRLAIFALALLVLFFTVNGYIQSAKNGDKATKANHKIDTLIDTVHNLSKTNRDQNRLINRLQKVERKQNHILAKHGFRTVVIPGDSSSGDGEQSSDNNPNENKPPPSDQPKPSHSPKPHPSHTPSPKPSGIVDRVCNLTGICLMKRGLNDFARQDVRHGQVFCTGRNPSNRSTIFCSFPSLGFAWW